MYIIFVYLDSCTSLHLNAVYPLAKTKRQQYYAA